MTRKQDLPADPRLRKIAEEVRATGREWTRLVATPHPALRLMGRRARETLVVGHRAARVRLGIVQWGRWDPERQVIHLDRGIAVDLSGRKAAVPVDLAPIPPGVVPMRWKPPVAGSRWLAGALVLLGLEALVLILAFPVLPRTPLGWVLLATLGPLAVLWWSWAGGNFGEEPTPAARPGRARLFRGALEAEDGEADANEILVQILLLVLGMPVLWLVLLAMGDR